MSVQQELFMNAVIASGGTIYSQPVDLAGNSLVFVGVTTVVGTAALDSTTGLEASSDLSNWAPLSPTPTVTYSAAPSYTASTYTGVGARYVRLKVKAGAAATCVNASLTASAS